MAIPLSTYTRPGPADRIPVDPKCFIEPCVPLFDLAFRLNTLPPVASVVPRSTGGHRLALSAEARATQSHLRILLSFSRRGTPMNIHPYVRNDHEALTRLPPTTPHGAKTIRPLRDLPQPACVEVCSEGHSHGHARLHTQMSPRSTRQTTRPFRLGLDQSQPRAARAPCVASTGLTHRIPPPRIIPTAGSALPAPYELDRFNATDPTQRASPRTARLLRVTAALSPPYVHVAALRGLAVEVKVVCAQR